MPKPLHSYIWRYALILIAVGLALLPVAWMATMAFKPHTEWVTSASDLHWWPHQETWGNFEYIFTGQTEAVTVSHERTAGKPILASLVTSLLGTLIAVVAGTLGAYAVSRFKVGGNLPLGVLQLRLFPPLAVMIPVMIMWAFLGAMDTWWGLSLIYGIVTLPFAFWLMKTFFDEVPREIEEAALVEGCSWFRVFWKVTLPMVKAALASTALFVFILNWSDYVIALLLTRKEWVTIPVYMNSLSSAMSGQMYGAKAALGLIAALPPVIFGIAIQKYLVRGLTFGALKQ
ncbi:MAG: carbohydrate ABC transporter permease [Rhodospirillaceae bacterium]|jgi:multiple sugar transport system permease protein|nr:carbohydrate ABC transporter permease [Rhodospirillaceae bacterium]MBT5781418.1 carbohydrate ABC transporter permease [Rhodospirillaceae bacterium]MBT6829076.1 carbohydrate ABC transporter permease [Rhodospirillaceae bacterium]MBT7292270.1 carbohydrate ABC transporter permease [Rhodospirillaceae bacterium]